MADYIISVVVLCGVLGLVGYLAYPSVSERTLRFASSVLIIYTVILPALSFVSGLGTEISDIIENIREESSLRGDEDYVTVAEEAICQGIREAIASKFNMSAENIEVKISGFDFESMRAEHIRVLLKGSSVIGDYRKIEEYTESLGLGECEVKIDFG